MALLAAASCADEKVDDPGPSIDAAPPEYAIGATVTGLSGSGLVLRLETTGAAASVVELPVNANGDVTFGSFPRSTSYTISVKAHPSSPTQICHLAHEAGQLGSVAVQAQVECAEPDLLISEVSSCWNATFNCWFEISNPTEQPIDLASYTVRSRARLRRAPLTVSNSKTFTLPSLVIPAGGYAVVRGGGDDNVFDGPAVALLRTADGFVPYWSDPAGAVAAGFIELVRASHTVDFVRFGDNAERPLGPGWGGAAVAGLTIGEDQFGYVIARAPGAADTDTSADWTQRAFATPAAANDVTSDADADADGIPDQAEVAGGTFGGIDLFAMGARTGRRDIFVEIDWMTSSEASVRPRFEALGRVVAAFAAHDIAIHFDTGALYSPTFDPARFNLGGGTEVPFASPLYLGVAAGSTNSFAYKAAYFDVRRTPVFHYVLFGLRIGGEVPASGYGEVVGNDIVVGLGPGFLTNTAANTNYLIALQAAVIMHELGHNLGLQHGGDETTNYKPNYISTMNYLYSYPGLPTIGQSEGDRYRLKWCTGMTWDQLVRSPFTTAWVLDYSNGASASIDESMVNESAGLGRVGSGAVDYDCSGATSNGYTRDLNDDTQLTSLTDFDDWSHLRLAFAHGPKGNQKRAPVRIDPMLDDQQQLADEGGFMPPRTSPLGTHATSGSGQAASVVR